MKALRVCMVIAGLCLAVVAQPAAAADLVVVASTAPGIAPGSVIKAGDALAVPAGAQVTVVAATGKTATIMGPHAGPPAIAGDGGGSPALIASLSGLLAGAGKDTAALGTMRAMAPAAAPPADPWLIDVDKSGEYCVAAGGAPVLWRNRGDRARVVTIIDLGDNREADVQWPAGDERLTWPAAVPTADGGRYLVRMKGRATATKLTLHRLPADLPTDAHRAAWMADNGCRAQARRLVAAIK